MKIIKHFFMLALAGLAFAACSNEDPIYDGRESENPNANAPDAYTAFAINIPNVPRAKAMTRASDPGTPEEYAVNTLHVFIYDAESPYTPTLAEFSVADGSLSLRPGSTSIWETNRAIKTKKADKYIFAGVNLPPMIIDAIKSQGFGAFNFHEFSLPILQATGPEGFVMFNAAYPPRTMADQLYPTEEEAQNPGTQLSIPVDRISVKASVAKGPEFVVNGGGTMTDLTYGWRNINQAFYFVQKMENGIIKDHNWSSYSPWDFNPGDDHLPVNESGAPIDMFSYAMENAFDFVPNVTLTDEATYLSISGYFRPDQVIRIRPQASRAYPSSGSDFEIIDNPNPERTTFYIVRTDDGVANYFADASVAETFAQLCNQGADGMPELSEPYDINRNRYDEGRCYYHLFVNGEANAPQAPYNIYRNQYYKVNLNSIQAPGNPDENFDKGKPIQPNAWLSVEIEVREWELIEENHDL